MKKIERAEDNRADSRTRPLNGKTVMVTRPRGQSDEFAARLEALGAAVIHFPTIEVAPPSSLAPLDASIGRLSEYDWIVFTSSNGVRFFFCRLVELVGDGAAALARCVICAIGPATARAIETEGAFVDITATDSRAEGALVAIVDYLGGEESVRDKRFLIPRAEVARETLPDALRSLGALVDTVETYQTILPAVERDAINRIFAETPIDIITFTSSSTVSNFAAMVGLEDISGFLSKTLVACVGPVTAATAESYGLRNTIQPQLYNSDALVEAIVKAIELRETVRPQASGPDSDSTSVQ